MRIAIAAASATRIGGVETYLASVIPALAARGHEVGCWFESRDDGTDPLVPHDFRGPVWVHGEPGGARLQPLRAFQPDVVFLHGLRSAELEREMTTIAPVAFFAHSYYGACISGEKSTRYPPEACTRVFGPMCLLHFYPRRCGGLSPVTLVRQFGLQRRKQTLLREYDVVLVASQHMAREYEAQGVKSRVVRLPAEDAGALARAPRTASACTLLFFGRLERSKGVHVALRSSALASERLGMPLRLVIAGAGSAADAVRAEAARATAAHPTLAVEFRGWIAPAARPAVFAEADLLLMPSLWPEPFGLVGVEAASAALPSVAFRVGGIEDWLVDGVTGTLVAPGGDAVERFASAIVTTLQDADRLETMRGEAVSAARRFNLAAHVHALEGVFSDLLKARGVDAR